MVKTSARLWGCRYAIATRAFKRNTVHAPTHVYAHVHALVEVPDPQDHVAVAADTVADARGVGRMRVQREGERLVVLGVEALHFLARTNLGDDPSWHA